MLSGATLVTWLPSTESEIASPVVEGRNRAHRVDPFTEIRDAQKPAPIIFWERASSGPMVLRAVTAAAQGRKRVTCVVMWLE